MKALKLKSSSKEDPIFATAEFNDFFGILDKIEESFQLNSEPDISPFGHPYFFSDITTLEYIKSRFNYSISKIYFNEWELVTVKITIE